MRKEVPFMSMRLTSLRAYVPYVPYVPYVNNVPYVPYVPKCNHFLRAVLLFQLEYAQRQQFQDPLRNHPHALLALRAYMPIYFM